MKTGQRAEAALSTLSHAAAAAPQRLRGLAAAAAATPAGQRALRLADGLPPLACVLLLDCSLIGAAAAAMAAAPSLVHSTLELDTQAPGVLQRVVALLPGLAPRLSLLLALPRLLTSLLDDAAAFLVALVGYHLLPVLLGGSLG
ncbi:hypothetical protein C2E20_7808 [Micractinium conductrix]|uniref:Uncharacterized protein n=1 Tax=Micractinium conductrix TaxID=554055 RepID=A0A2P6V399_9CHLO|nr:hypothetical protein C2E20_7808 [Micractinium conductrix]|eukprot:PSC68569.1 hypothetical protein C2E20_7808 [Micractinium conductrix]